MAVQKDRKSRSRRDMRRSANSKLTNPTLSTDSTTGETHRRHHISPKGHYKGRQVIAPKAESTEKQPQG